MDNEALAGQVRVPMAIADFLPIGVVGVFLAVMIMLMISTDTTYLHSWGSIFVQDIVLPLRGQPFTPRGQAAGAAAGDRGDRGVRVFLQLAIPPDDADLHVLRADRQHLPRRGGCGDHRRACIGNARPRPGRGRRWSSARSSRRRVSFSSITGSTLIAPLGDVGLTTTWTAAHADDFPINGQWMWMIAMLAAIVTFIVVSLADLPRAVQHGADAPPRRIRPNRMTKCPRPAAFIQGLIGLDKVFTPRRPLAGGVRHRAGASCSSASG